MTLSKKNIDESCLADAIKLSQHPGQGTLDLRGSEWMCPSGAVALTLLVQHRAQQGLATRLLAPTGDDLLNYLGRIDFFEHLPDAVEVDRDLNHLSSHRRLASDRFTTIILPHSRGVEKVCSVVSGFFEEEEPERWGRLYAPFDEALSNIDQHASYGLMGTAFSCTQVQIYTNRIEIAFGDLGVGFLRTLSGGSAPLSSPTEEAALREAFENRRSRRGPGSHHGGGLRNIGRVARSMGGRLRMVTGDGAVSQRGSGRRRYETLSASFPGVIGWVRLPA